MEIFDAQIKKYGKEEEGIESLKDFDYEQKSDYFDKERKFCWWNGNLYPSFGKYRRKKHIKDIARNDSPYLEWMLGKDFSDEIKTMVKNALAGAWVYYTDDFLATSPPADKTGNLVAVLPAMADVRELRTY